ncbi:hypothetical protein C0J52_00352 [Blattella germanica]|nr:hypothetical protein C0J52_00352 [Blattella germanica]
MEESYLEGWPADVEQTANCADSQVEDEATDDPNKTDDDEGSDDTDDSMPSADGWRKYRSQPDFVRFNFTAQSGFKPRNPAPNDVREFFMLFISIILNSVT